MLQTMLKTEGYGNKALEEYEPFSPKLWERAKELARQEEDLIEEIAALRRKMPGVAVENVKRTYKAGVEDDERILERFGERVKGEGVEFGAGELERREDVEQSWKKGVRGLEGLKGSLPEYVAKAERARRAEGYVLESRGK